MMKNFLLSFFNYWLYISTVAFAVGCTSSPTLLEQTSTVNTTQTPATTRAMAVATTTAITMLTNMPSATSTHFPTDTPTPLPPTATVTSSPTLMPIPTLNSIEEEALVQELMAANGECQLPCWWGIHLGENLGSIGEAFTRLGLGSWRVSVSDFGDNGERGYIKSGYFDPASSSYHVSISMDFYSVDSVVQFIEVAAQRPLRQQGEEELARDWEPYSLSSILQKYGRPPYAYLIPQNVADPGPPNYVLILYYPELGFKFSYQPHEPSASDTQTQFCLNLEVMRQINLSLYNPEFVDVWPNYLLPPALNTEIEGGLFEQWTWEAQTGMDLDAFYETYQDPDNLGCIQLN